jgi:undecaprenyl-diphosphatase
VSWWEGALLGLVQGLTEFLPVSSSGHLVLGDAVLGLQLPGVLFEAAVHLATLLAVLWVYRGRIAELASGALRGEAATWRYIGLLALASVPTAVIGLAGESYLAASYEEPLVAASLLLVTGGLVLSLRWTGRTDGRPEPSPAAALLIGLAQGVLSSAVYSAILIMVILTTFMAPPALKVIFERAAEPAQAEASGNEMPEV